MLLLLFSRPSSNRPSRSIAPVAPSLSSLIHPPTCIAPRNPSSARSPPPLHPSLPSLPSLPSPLRSPCRAPPRPRLSPTLPAKRNPSRHLRPRQRTDGNEANIAFMPCVADCKDSAVHSRALQRKRTKRRMDNVPQKTRMLETKSRPGWGYSRHTHRKAPRLQILRTDSCPQGMRGVPVVRSGVSLFCFLLSHERSTLVSTKSEPYRTGYPYAVPQGVRPQPLLGIRRPESHVRPESAQTRLMSTYLVELLFEAHQTSFAFTNLRPLDPLGSLLS